MAEESKPLEEADSSHMHHESGEAPNAIYSDAEIIDALRQTGGLLAPAAKLLGCDRATLRRRKKSSETIRLALVEIEETTLDVAEAQLFKAIKAGDMRAISFYLRTKGKARGYTMKIEGNVTVTPADGPETTPDDVAQAESPEDALKMFEKFRSQHQPGHA